jgi:hypothetical protein
VDCDLADKTLKKDEVNEGLESWDYIKRKFIMGTF